jgi:hypothetical protein
VEIVEGAQNVVRTGGVARGERYQGCECVANLGQHGGLKGAGLADGGLDVQDGAVGGLADRGEVVKEAMAVEVLQAADGGGVVSGLEIAPGGELLELGFGIGGILKLAVEAGLLEAGQDVLWAELNGVVLLGVEEDLNDGPVGIGRIGAGAYDEVAAKSPHYAGPTPCPRGGTTH